MKVAILGNGGREHALCEMFRKSKKFLKFILYRNAGTESISENVNIDINNFELLKDFIFKSKIDFVVVGPEKPLVEGIVDFLKENNIKVFGPNKNASKLKVQKFLQKNFVKIIIFNS